MEKAGCKLNIEGQARGAGCVVVLSVLLVAVGVVILAAYWPGLSAKALMLDDDQYLVNNRLVQNPGWESAKRFITEVLKPSTVRGYYQPLAMISLMLDVAMGAGVDNLRPFHYTSLALHIANSLLLAVFIYLLFGRIWPAAMVGLLYGVHPITIESVAWVSERKTVLAAFFAMWSLLFYLSFIRRRYRRHYVLCLLMFVLSLLSKPSIVGLPILLLLLDFWPLRRLNRRAVLEKLPLFAVAALFSVITFLSQSGTSLVKMPGQSGLGRVMLICCHNIIFYLYNLFWPVNLSWYYPFPKPFNLSQPIALAGVIGTCLLIVTLLISLRRTRSLAAGWLFFFVAIFPTLGVIGFHPMIAADRHMYFPMVGFFLILGWLFSRIWKDEKKIVGLGLPARRIILTAVVVLLAASEFILTRCYLVHWRDSESVYRYMLKLSPDVVVLHNNLGNVLGDLGKDHQAFEHFTRSLKLKPNSPKVHSNIGNTLERLGRLDEAIEHYKKALSLRPGFSEAHYNLASALVKKGRTDEAIAEYRQALRYRPDDVDALNNLGFVLTEQGEFDEAIEYYKKAIEIEPANIIAHGRLGLVLAGMGKIDEAIEEFWIVLKARPDDVEMRCNVGILLAQQGRTSEAIEQYRKALQINPDYTKAAELLEETSAKDRQNDN